MRRSGFFSLSATVLLAGWAVLPVSAQTANDMPEFHEVYSLIQEYLPGVKPQELDHAAAEGLAMALSPRVILITNNASSSGSNQESGPIVLRTSVFDGQIAYVRIARVSDKLPEEIRNACRDVGKTNKLKGVVLDLRYAHGDDYQGAGAAADVFIKKEQTLINWGTGEYHSKHSDDDLAFPVAALVNHETRGAAEALAGIIRQAGAGLVIGRKTAGQAMVAREVTLKNGDLLRIATARVMLGDGTALTSQGVAPDITVDVSAADERAYYADAFKVLTRPEVASAAGSGTNSARGSSNLASSPTTTTNRTVRRPRFNEAELVRERREGTLSDDLAPEREAEPDKPVVRDPALARALDLLKGLAVVRQGPS
jgi:hypothetical protein